MNKQLLWLSLISLSSCVLSRELYGRYYWVGAGTFGISQEELENRVSSLYTNKIITANNSVWAYIKARDAKAKYGKVIDFSIIPDKGYSLEKTGRKHFQFFNAKNQAFYSFSFWNFRGVAKANTPCDLFVESVTVLQSDSTLRELKWREAGPALAVFKHEVLPIIRKQVKGTE